MMLKCPECGARIPIRWLMLSPPWGRHTCATCLSTLAGTPLRTTLTSAVVFLLGFVVIPVLKGRANALLLLPVLGLTAMVFLLNLPHQLRRVGRAT